MDWREFNRPRESQPYPTPRLGERYDLHQYRSSRAASGAVSVDYLLQATSRMAQVHFELTSKGLPEGVVTRGINRARGEAEFHTRHISSAIKGQAFLET